MKAQRGSRGIALPTHNFHHRKGPMVERGVGKAKTVNPSHNKNRVSYQYYYNKITHTKT
jgi:hypothetical protein